MSLSDIANGTVSGAADVDRKFEGATSTAGGNIFSGALHAGQGVLQALGATQRGAMGVRKYVDDHHLAGGAILQHPDQLGDALQQGRQFFMDPKKQDETSRIARGALSTAPGSDGFIPTDAQINDHLHGFAATAARFAAQAGSDVLTDPTTYLDGAGLIRGAAKVVPQVPRAFEALAKTRAGQGLSAAFNAEHHLQGLTPHGQNLLEGTRNVVKQTAEHAAGAENDAIAAARKQIAGGAVPANIQAILAKYGVTAPAGVTPSKLISLLSDARGAKTATDTRDALTTAGILGHAPGQLGLFGAGANAADIFKDVSPAGIDGAIKGVLEHIKPPAAGTSGAEKFIAKTNNQLKGLFLAIPLPHVGNLTNLAYNRYGMGTTLRGLYYAAREATGQRGKVLQDLVDRLKAAGADNQYSKIFSEVNGAPVVGGAIRTVQRAANKAQDVILNPVERGLRASMLQAEEAAGRTGFDAARGIHKALGSDAATGLTQALSRLPLSQFPRFHTQTALGSFGHTLVNNPGRITGFEHVFGGPNRKPDGTPHYRLATPTAAGLNMMNNPLQFLTSPSTLGGLSGVTNPFGAIGQGLAGMRADLRGQHLRAAKDFQGGAASLVQPAVPGGPQLSALLEMLKNKRGSAGQTGIEDLLSSIAGGYWTKR